MSDQAFIEAAHEKLLADEPALTRLNQLRGWTTDAARTLGLGLDTGRVVIPITDGQGRLVNVLRYQPNTDKRQTAPKMIGSPSAPRDLFPAPESIDPAATLWLLEGEPDAIAATSIGLPAVAIPGSNGWKPDMASRFAGRDIVICTDCDNPGRSLAERVADDLLEHARTVRRVDLAPARDDSYDLGDLVREGADNPDNVRRLLTRVAEDAPIHVPADERPPRPRLSTADWRKSLLDYLEGRDQQPAWPIPFTALLEAADGGIRPGEVWILAGYTSHGKSIYVDMLADTCADAGARVHLYMTEMTIVQRGLRLLARRTGIPFRDLRRRELDGEQMAVARREIALLNYGATVVTDWTPAQVAADIRATRTNVAIIDLLHGFHYSDERQLSAFVNEFAASATTDAGGTGYGSAVVLVCHLNDAQMRDSRSPARPKPGLHSLKGATSIKQRADTVMFAWLQDDDDGVPTDDGAVWIAKARNGGLAAQPITLDRGALMFRERRHLEVAA
jgi:hypothetical protein